MNEWADKIANRLKQFDIVALQEVCIVQTKGDMLADVMAPLMAKLQGLFQR